MRRLVIAIAALLLFTPTVNAQRVGVLTHDAILHSGPSSSSDRVGVSQVGDAVTPLRNGHRSGYLRVRTQDEDVGWVYDVFRVIPGGHFETTNCRKGDPVHRDTHIELAASPTDTVETRRVIVEVTPRWRAAVLRYSVDWSTATLEQTLEGHWVKVRGWLMFDSKHKGQSENTPPGGDGNWRATAWEIHPISSITLVNQP